MLGERKGIYHQPNSIAEILHITRPQNVNLTPYDDRTPEIHDILQVLGPDHEVSSKGTSISTAKFAPELTTLKLQSLPAVQHNFHQSQKRSIPM